MESKNTNTVTKTELLTTRQVIPSDLHWIPPGTFLGEIYDIFNNKHYSSLGGKKYRPKHDNKHLDEGHFQGYRFAIQHLTKPKQVVFDPTVGSGTAIIEAINNDRVGYGIELEWPDLCKKNIDYQKKNNGKVFKGNAHDLLKIMGGLKTDLIINGTPYPVNGKDGGTSSDAPFRMERMSNYIEKDSYGLLGYPNGNYEKFIRKMYKDCYQLMNPGSYLCLIIKDPIRNKQPFLLQKMLCNWITEDTGLVYHSWFCHKHVPETLFIRTYRLKYPEVKLPLYQIGVVLKKINHK